MTMLVRLVDDDPDLLAAQKQALTIAGFTTETFTNAIEALACLTRDYPGVILTDVRMPHMDGLEFHERLRVLDPDLPVILLTGHGDVAMAVGAMRNGAWDFLTKPVSSDALTAALRRACHARTLVLENRALRQMAPSGTDTLIGDSPAMTALRETALRLGEAGADALITGPSGSGKEALARAIHQSGRKSRSFVHIACDTLDEARFDADFLGAEAGHPPAPRHARHIGRIERAHRGVLFLDNVDQLPLPLQARLLHLIEAGEFWSLGATAARPSDMQVIAATRADLAALVATGRFRAGLFYRLSGITVTVPPLAMRREDIAPLFRHFLLAASVKHGIAVPQVTAMAQAHLTAHNWPGNLRELQQFANAQALGLTTTAATGQGGDDLATMLGQYEAGIIADVLRATKGNATKAMARLGLSRKTFYDRLAKHDINAADYR